MNQKNNIINQLPEDAEEILKKHYLDKPASTIKGEEKVNQESDFKDFSKASESFYKNSEYILTYKKGYTIGQYGSQEQRFEVFIKRIKDGIKEIVTDEIRSEGHTTENLANTYKLIDNSFDLLVENINNNNIKLNMKKLITKMHGFINGYVNHTKIIED